MGTKAHRMWTRMSIWIAETYPEVFTPEWLFLGVMSEKKIADVQRLLTTKRKPKRSGFSKK